MLEFSDGRGDVLELQSRDGVAGVLLSVGQLCRVNVTQHRRRVSLWRYLLLWLLWRGLMVLGWRRREVLLLHWRWWLLLHWRWRR